eukprot:4000381-Alexandrium_andersonii.AAC.1
MACGVRDIDGKCACSMACGVRDIDGKCSAYLQPVPVHSFSARARTPRPPTRPPPRTQGRARPGPQQTRRLRMPRACAEARERRAVF